GSECLSFDGVVSSDLFSSGVISSISVVQSVSRASVVSSVSVKSSEVVIDFTFGVGLFDTVNSEGSECFLSFVGVVSSDLFSSGVISSVFVVHSVSKASVFGSVSGFVAVKSSPVGLFDTVNSEEGSECLLSFDGVVSSDLFSSGVISSVSVVHSVSRASVVSSVSVKSSEVVIDFTFGVGLFDTVNSEGSECLLSFDGVVSSDLFSSGFISSVSVVHSVSRASVVSSVSGFVAVKSLVVVDFTFGVGLFDTVNSEGSECLLSFVGVVPSDLFSSV
ncbi:hypothetical protein DNTS_020913, partial [Danionella cerebrum]